MESLGECTNIEVLESWVTLSGQRLIDIGAGDLGFSRQLLDAGAEVLAIDPDPVQAAKNRKQILPPGLQFREASAESLPCDSSFFDGAVFAYSLHHIPVSLYPAVFAEVQRVLKPDGFLHVIEPLDCPWNQVMKTFHDEDREREAAQLALQELALPNYRVARQVAYHGYTQYESFEAFAEKFAAKTFNELYSPEQVWQPTVRTAFERHGGPDYRFQSPKTAMFLQGPLGCSNGS